MYTSLINPSFQPYTSASINFKGTQNPVTAAEKLQRILRDLYHSATESKGIAGYNHASEAKKQIVKLLREAGVDEKIVKEFEIPVDDDLRACY